MAVWHLHVVLAGLFFNSLRQSLIAGSDFPHSLLSTRVLHNLDLGQDFFRACSPAAISKFFPRARIAAAVAESEQGGGSTHRGRFVVRMPLGGTSCWMLRLLVSGS